MQACLLLKAGVGVVPVGAGLLDLEAIDEGLAWHDAWVAHPWHAIHRIGEDDPMPVQAGGFVQMVGDAQRHHITLFPVQRGGRKHIVDGIGQHRLTGDIDPGLFDM